MINKNRYHKILTRRKENVSKDREEENLETREEKKNGGRAKKSRETLIPPLLSHSTDIISLFIYPPTKWIVEGRKVERTRGQEMRNCAI